MEIFGEFLIFEMLGSRYPKIEIFKGFEESFQLLSFRKKSILYRTKAIFHDYQWELGQMSRKMIENLLRIIRMLVLAF